MKKLFTLTMVLVTLALMGTKVMNQTQTTILNTGYDQLSNTKIDVGQQDNVWKVMHSTPNNPLTPPPATGRPADVVNDSVWADFNKAFTWTITGLIVDNTVTYQDCDRLPIQDIPGLTSITFWESSSTTPAAFTPPPSALTTRLKELNSSNKDFEGAPGEFYDVFYSDRDGAFNPRGQFVTIEAVWNVGAPSGGGLNIARVDFNGTGQFANSVASFVALGDNALPNDVGKAVDLDPNVLTDTTMGNTIGQTQRLRITVGFPCRTPCVQPNSITLNPAAGALPTPVTNTPYRQTLTATGGVAPYTFSASGGPLPPGLTISSAGTLSGTPTQSGTFTAAIKVTDANGCASTRRYRLVIRCQDFLINATELPSGTATTPYNQTLVGASVCAPNTLSVLAGTLPPGLTLSPDGTLSGTPTVRGNFAFAVRATNGCGCTNQRSYRLIIKPCTFCNSVDLFSVGAVNLQPNEASRYNYFASLRSTADIRAAKLTAEPILSKVLRLNLFPQDNYEAVMDKLEQREDGSYTWKGTIQGQIGNVILVVKGNQITGWVWVGHATKGERYFSITSLGGGIHVIRKTDQAWFDSISPGCSTTGATTPIGRSPLSVEPNNPADNPKTSSGKVTPETGVPQKTMPNAVASNCNIDVLVVYTRATREAYGDVPALAQLAVDQANTTYANSKVTGLGLNLVGTMEVNYTESGTKTPEGSLTDLVRLKNQSDGFLDDVHAQRASLSADFVVLLVDDLTKLDLHGQAAAVGAEFDTAFAVVDWESAVDNLSFPHEVGHLKGARHDHEADKSDKPYKYGHGMCRNKYRTIMATSASCNKTRVPYWSNPDVEYKNQKTGAKRLENNARVLRETACTMSSLVEPVSCPHIAVGNLVLNSSADHVFFIGTDWRVYNHWRNGNKWQLDWLGPAQIATPGSLLLNSSGDSLFFIGNDNGVYTYQWNNGWQLDSLGPERIASEGLVLSSSGDKLFFIGTDKRVYNYSKNGANWQLKLLGRTAIAEGSLVLNSSADKLFFTGTDRRVYNYTNKGTNWQLEALGTETLALGALGPLVLNSSADRLLFTGTDRRAHVYWKNGAIWQLASSGPKEVAGGSRLVLNTSEDHVFFSGIDGRVYDYWFDNGILNWVGPTQIAGGDVVLNSSTDHIFFIGADKRMYNYWWNNGWQLDWLGPAQIAHQSAVLNTAGDRLFFISTDRQVYNYRWNNGWKLERLCP